MPYVLDLGELVVLSGDGSLTYPDGTAGGTLVVGTAVAGRGKPVVASEGGLSLFVHAETKGGATGFTVQVLTKYDGPLGAPDARFGNVPLSFFSNLAGGNVLSQAYTGAGSVFDDILQLSGARYAGPVVIKISAAGAGLTAADFVLVAAKAGSWVV